MSNDNNIKCEGTKNKKDLYKDIVDIQSEYTEKKWGKEDAGEFIVDGFTFKGKHVFKRAKDGLVELMKKGVQSEVEGNKFKVLDTRSKGNGLEIDVETSDKGVRGVAVLKLYGPNKEKDYTVMVNKRKNSEHKYVILLAEKIVKPLMKKYLSIDGSGKEENPDKPSEEGSPKNPFQCSYCEKVFKSNPGLKSHVTRMHKKNQGIEEEHFIDKQRCMSKQVEIDEKELNLEAKKVVDNILKEIIEISDDEESLDGITLEEENNTPKIYINNCEFCGYETQAKKRYRTIQLLKKHKEICSKHLKCTRCDFSSNDRMDLRRHNRDQHEDMLNSTSPPLKRKKRMFEKTPIEPEPLVVTKRSDSEEMEIDENTSEEIKDLSFKLEDMEIDTINKDEEISNMVDRKIIEKAKRIEGEERLSDLKLKANEIKKKKEEEVNIEKTRKLNKMRKQKIKDEKKKRNKKDKNKSKNEVFVSKIPNIRQVPKNCIHLVKKNDLLYVVPGDGKCGPSSASAFLFGDEVFGGKLRSKMNKFMAKHWHKRYKNITQCSKDHPFVRKLGGGEVKFEDPVKLVKYLRSSIKAEGMWCDSEDLAVIADLYQVKIKVITTAGEKDKNPSINWIYPDESMNEFAELKNVDMDTMVLLHEKDTHFNLVVSKDSELARFGSLSYRANIGPMMNVGEEEGVSNVEKEELEVGEVFSSESNAKEVVDLKKELKLLKDSKIKVELELSKCEGELKAKTEEVEKLKSEIKDINQIDDLEKILKDSNEDVGSEAEKVFKPSYKPSGKSKVKKGKVVELEYNCDECFYQGTTSGELLKHNEIKHKASETPRNNLGSSVKCRNCGEVFESKYNFMVHRKIKHLSTVAYCRNYANKTCSYSSEMCWWNHTESNEGEEKVKCFICGIIFQNKRETMIHRKKEHKSFVRDCNLYLENKCKYKEESCWFKHREIDEEKDDEEIVIEEEVDEHSSESVFWNAKENLKPPLEENPEINH